MSLPRQMNTGRKLRIEPNALEREHMHATLEINIPNYASAVVTTSEIVDALTLTSKNSTASAEA